MHIEFPHEISDRQATNFCCVPIEFPQWIFVNGFSFIKSEYFLVERTRLSEFFFIKLEYWLVHLLKEA